MAHRNHYQFRDKHTVGSCKIKWVASLGHFVRILPVLVEYSHIFILVSVGIHTPELPSVEWMDDDIQSEVKSEFTSFGNVSKNLFSSLSSFMHARGRRDHACNIFD